MTFKPRNTIGWNWRFVLNGTGALFILAFGAASGVSAEPAIAIHVKGTVEKKLTDSPEWKPIEIGDRLPEGADVRTGPKSETDLDTSQGHRLHVEPDTQLKLSSLRADKTKTYLSHGIVHSKVQPLKDLQQFLIETPAAVCAVRGTEFWTGSSPAGTAVDVSHGIVGLTAQGTRNEVLVHASETARVLRDGRIIPPHGAPQGAAASPEDSAIKREARHEVALDMTRNQVMAAAASEIRLAEYREGKSLIDAQGKRVRLEEYIVRPQPNQFKFVVLDERDQQLDYFFYLGTFNQNLPTDLSVALRDLSGKFGTAAPDYYLTSYEMGQSNTQDSVHDTATGGHLVSIVKDSNGDFLLTDSADPTHTRTVPGIQANGSNYDVYNPLTDSFSTVSASQLAAATTFGVYIPENSTYQDLAAGDTFWKTRFNTYDHLLNNVPKISYAASGPNVLASTLDANWTIAGGIYVSEVTMDANNIDATITNHYGDQTFESYRTVLIDNEGAIAPQSAFAGISTGAAYKNELLKWNYEQQVSATEFEGRKIDLVVEPKIFIQSGLIQ